jgi:quinol monooxygenase YgiN
MIVLKVDMLVKPGAEEKCKEYIRILQEHSRREPGCLMFVGHQSTENPRKFLFYEQYRDQAALVAHRDALYYKQYVQDGLGAIMESRTRELYSAIE